MEDALASICRSYVSSDPGAGCEIIRTSSSCTMQYCDNTQYSCRIHLLLISRLPITFDLVRRGTADSRWSEANHRLARRSPDCRPSATATSSRLAPKQQHPPS